MPEKRVKNRSEHKRECRTQPNALCCACNRLRGVDFRPMRVSTSERVKIPQSRPDQEPGAPWRWVVFLFHTLLCTFHRPSGRRLRWVINYPNQIKPLAYMSSADMAVCFPNSPTPLPCPFDGHWLMDGLRQGEAPTKMVTRHKPQSCLLPCPPQKVEGCNRHVRA